MMIMSLRSARQMWHLVSTEIKLRLMIWLYRPNYSVFSYHPAQTTGAVEPCAVRAEKLISNLNSFIVNALK